MGTMGRSRRRRRRRATPVTGPLWRLSSRYPLLGWIISNIIISSHSWSFYRQLGHTRCCPIKLSIDTPNYLHLKHPPPAHAQTLWPILLEASASWAMTEGVPKCSKSWKMAPKCRQFRAKLDNVGHPTPVHVITRLCPLEQGGAFGLRRLGRVSCFQQSAIEAPPSFLLRLPRFSN